MIFRCCYQWGFRPLRKLVVGIHNKERRARPKSELVLGGRPEPYPENSGFNSHEIQTMASTGGIYGLLRQMWSRVPVQVYGGLDFV